MLLQSVSVHCIAKATWLLGLEEHIQVAVLSVCGSLHLALGKDTVCSGHQFAFLPPIAWFPFCQLVSIRIRIQFIWQNPFGCGF